MAQRFPEKASTRNVDFFKAIPEFLADILEEVTTSEVAYDLRGAITLMRIAQDSEDPESAAIVVSMDGHVDQTFIVRLGQ